MLGSANMEPFSEPPGQPVKRQIDHGRRVERNQLTQDKPADD